VWRAKGLGVRGPLRHGHLSAGDLRATGEMFVNFGVYWSDPLNCRHLPRSVGAGSFNAHITRT